MTMNIQATILVPAGRPVDLERAQYLAASRFGQSEWTGFVYPFSRSTKIKHACLTVEIDSFADLRLVHQLATDIGHVLNLSEISMRVLGLNEKIELETDDA